MQQDNAAAILRTFPFVSDGLSLIVYYISAVILVRLFLKEHLNFFVHIYIYSNLACLELLVSTACLVFLFLSFLRFIVTLDFLALCAKKCEFDNSNSQLALDSILLMTRVLRHVRGHFFLNRGDNPTQPSIQQYNCYRRLDGTEPRPRESNVIFCNFVGVSSVAWES